MVLARLDVSGGATDRAAIAGDGIGATIHPGIPTCKYGGVRTDDRHPLRRKPGQDYPMPSYRRSLDAWGQNKDALMASCRLCARWLSGEKRIVPLRFPRTSWIELWVVTSKSGLLELQCSSHRRCQHIFFGHWSTSASLVRSGNWPWPL